MSLRVETSTNWNGDEVKYRGRKVVGKSTYEIGLAVEAQTKALAPVKFGRLRGSYTTQSADQGTEVEAPARPEDKITGPSSGLDTYVGTAVYYGPYVELGTVRSDAQPHLRPAFDLAQGKVLTLVRKNAKWEFGDYLKQ